MTAAVLPLPHPGRSPFAGADICQQAGLTLPAGASRPNFDDDLWDFTDVAGLPVSLALAVRRFSFAQIADPRWRLTAKELIFAMLVPRHEAVAELPRAFRTPMHLTTAGGRLKETTQFLNWLAGQGISSLAAVGAYHCEAYLSHRRYVLGEHGAVVGERSPASAVALPRPSSTCSTTASCSPPTGPILTSGPGAGPPPPRSRRCPPAGT